MLPPHAAAMLPPFSMPITPIFRCRRFDACLSSSISLPPLAMLRYTPAYFLMLPCCCYASRRHVTSAMLFFSRLLRLRHALRAAIAAAFRDAAVCHAADMMPPLPLICCYACRRLHAPCRHAACLLPLRQLRHAICHADDVDLRCHVLPPAFCRHFFFSDIDVISGGFAALPCVVRARARDAYTALWFATRCQLRAATQMNPRGVWGNVSPQRGVMSVVSCSSGAGGALYVRNRATPNVASTREYVPAL